MNTGTSTASTAKDAISGTDVHHLILFDGVCDLCNGLVQFVIKRDKRELFRFASLQSAFGQRFLKKQAMPGDHYDSVIYIRRGVVLLRSTAALTIARDLGGAWSFAYAFIIVPRFIRDGVYDLVARNRYKWFGRKDVCMVPTPELRARFLT